MHPRSRLGKRSSLVRVLVASLGLLLPLAGCTVFTGTISTITALTEAGFENPNISAQGGDVIDIQVTRDDEDLTACAKEAAGIVWRELPFRIEVLNVVCGNGFGGTGQFSAERLELEALFGPRDPDLDRGVRDEDVRNVALIIAAVAIGGVLVLIAVVVTIILLVRRNRRRAPPPPPPPAGFPPGPPPPGYPGAPPPPYHPPS